MSSTSDYVAANLAKIAQRQVKAAGNTFKAPRPVGEREQVRRFIAGEERARLLNGEVTPEQYYRYVQSMGKKLGVI